MNKIMSPSLETVLKKAGFKKVKETGFLGMKGGTYGPMTVSDAYFKHNKEVATTARNNIIEKLSTSKEILFYFDARERSPYEYDLVIKNSKGATYRYGFYFSAVERGAYQHYYLTYVELPTA